jgi:hypothetical protein
VSPIRRPRDRTCGSANMGLEMVLMGPGDGG